MSFSAKFIVDDKTYTVRRFSWSVQQNTDTVGRPEPRVQGGQFQVELDSEPDDMLHHWAKDNTKRISGELVVLSNNNADVRHKTVKFEGAYCVTMGKDFDGSFSTKSMLLSFTMSANQIGGGELKHDNTWPA